jgi:hypothetical protein
MTARGAGSFLSPARALGGALLAAGAVLVHLNATMPDESRWLGACMCLAGLVGIVLPETARRWTLLTVTTATGLLLIGGEAAVRRENARAQAAFDGQLIHFVADRDLRYELVPRARCGATSTNELGMVDVARAVDKPEGVLRVACLGDSVGADCSLPGETTCPVLERLLRDRRGGRPTEALNFSVFGYNALQEARSLESKAAAFRPDAVVVLYVVNDPYPDLAISHFRPGHLVFEHLLYSGTRALGARALGSSLVPLPEIHDLYDRGEAWDAVVVPAFERIAQAAAKLGAPVVVAVFPLFTQPQAKGYAEIYARVADEARRHGLVGLDLSQAAYAGVPVATLLKPSRDPIHPNALAHRMAAEAIADALVAASPGMLAR